MSSKRHRILAYPSLFPPRRSQTLGGNEGRLARGTGLRIPSRIVRQSLEVRAGDERHGEVSGIDNLRGHHQLLISVWRLDAVVILGEHRVRTIGNTVRSQIAR